MSDVVGLLALLVAVAALVVSLFALRWAKESARAGRVSAIAAASAEAARVETAAGAAVRWQLIRTGRDQVSARSLGPDPAYEVHVVTSSTQPNGPPLAYAVRAEMLPGAVYPFDVMFQERLPDPWAEVRWKLGPDDPTWRTRRLQLPPPPFDPLSQIA